MIYTNNQGPTTWSHMITCYFETKMKKDKNDATGPILFDQIIQAFKIRGKRVELLRTSHKKMHSDLIRCTHLPSYTEICFLDDTLHADMCNDKIYYINLKPYVYKLQFEQLISRFLKSTNATVAQIRNRIVTHDCKNTLLQMMNEYEYTYSKKNMEEYDMDKIISKKIMHHLNSFFTKDMDNRLEHAVVVNCRSKNSKPTKVRRRQKNNKTKKIK